MLSFMSVTVGVFLCLKRLTFKYFVVVVYFMEIRFFLLIRVVSSKYKVIGGIHK